MARSRTHAESKSTIGSETITMQSAADSKKELKQEIADIRGFTLIFENESMEMKWNLMHLERHIGITTRYLFAASAFQGLFYWSDCLESHGDSTYLFHLGCLRLLLGGLTLLGCFLVSTGLVIPTQLAVFWINMCYGFPSLAIFYLARPTASVFDSLFLVYGLCFFILPKISPLNFIFGFSGALLYTILFIYISAFRLSLQQWLLSNTFLMIIVSLFCYISYSAERVSRERWLLRERLKGERINLRIVASSIQDDLTRAANDERNYPLDVMNPHNFRYDNSGKAIRLLATLGRGGAWSVHHSEHDETDEGRNESTAKGRAGNMNESSVMSKQKRMSLFFRSLGGWALCYGMGYAFDYVSQPASSFPREINSSPAFALLMHSMGFSVFLMSFTGQIRWLALNGIVGLALMWVFNRSGMDSRWVVFSTHSVGYVLLALVVIIMILVFGGVVLVWSHLIDFLKEILVRYPEVKQEISENKVLEQVLIRYISDMPKTKFLSRSGREHFREGDGDGEDSAPHVLQVYKDCDSDEEIQGKAFQSVVYLSAGKGDTLYGMSDSKGHSAKNTVKNKINTDIIPLLADGLHSSPTGSADAGVRRHEVSLSPQHSSNSSSSPAFPQATPCKGVKGKHAIQKSGKKGALSDRVFCTETDCKSFGLRVIAAKRADSCFFCLKSRPQVLVPACIGWLPHPETSPSDTGIPMCTPYTEMIRVRDEALAAANMAQLGMVEAVVKSDAAEAERSVACASMAKMQKRMGEMEAAMMQLVKSCDSQVSAEKKQRDADVQSIIAQHNLQLSELKRLHKAIAAKQSASAAAALSMVSASTSSQQELNASPTHPSVCQSAGTAPSHPFRAVQGASLHPAPMPHPALHSNRTSVVPSKLLATHPGHSNETTRHASHPAVHHPTPPTYSTTQTSHLSVSSQQHVKPVQSRSEQQQGGESMTQGLPGPNGVFLQSDSPTQPQTQVAAIFIKSQGNIDRTGISADGRALNSEHTMRAPLHSSKTLDGSYEHCGGLESSSMSAGRDARTEGHLQLSSLLHVTPSESYSGMISTTIAPGTFDPRHESYEELTIDSATQNGLYAPSIHRLLQSSDRHTDHSYNASFLMETQDFDHYRYMNNQTQYFPGEVAAYSALQRSHAPEEAESSVDAHRPMSCDSLNPYYKYSGGDSFSSQRQQSDEVDLNDAESRFWLPSLDFDEIQQLLHQELRYPTPGTSPKTVKDSDEFPTIH